MSDDQSIYVPSSPLKTVVESDEGIFHRPVTGAIGLDRVVHKMTFLILPNAYLVDLLTVMSLITSFSAVK